MECYAAKRLLRWSCYWGKLRSEYYLSDLSPLLLLLGGKERVLALKAQLVELVKDHAHVQVEQAKGAQNDKSNEVQRGK